MNHLRGTYMNSIILNEITIDALGCKGNKKVEPKKGFWR